MTQQTAEHYRNRIRFQLEALQTKLADLKAAHDALANSHMLPFLDEDRIVRVLGEPKQVAAPTPAQNGRSVGYRQPNRGIRAKIIRCLMGGPATADELAEIVEATDRGALECAVNDATTIRLITRNGLTLSLTDEGRKQGEWLMAHPTAKLYAPYLDRK